MKSSIKTKGTPTMDAVLGITITTIESPFILTSSLTPPTLAHVVKCLKRKKRIKRLYFPLRGIPNGMESISVAGNHFHASFGKGGSEALASECPVLEDDALDKSSMHQVIENLNRSLLIEANVFIHRRRT
jgi:hypothetical protein